MKKSALLTFERVAMYGFVLNINQSEVEYLEGFIGMVISYTPESVLLQGQDDPYLGRYVCHPKQCRRIAETR